jgi:RNA methyltransferase, TrmH family
MTLISSRSNPKIKLLRSLRQRKGREAAGLFLVEGIRPVGEAVEAGVKIDSIYYSPDLLTSQFAQQLIKNQQTAGVPCYSLNRDVFESVAEKENPQGILAAVQLPEYKLVSLSPANLNWGAALVNPQDPGNVGTILRTLDAVGANGLFLLDSGLDLGHPSLVRSSMGVNFWYPVVRTSFDEFIRWSRQHGYTLLGTSAHGELDYRELPPCNLPLVLMMGSEREGLTKEQLAACSSVVRLPMRGRSTSLNLAVATGVMLYAMLEKLVK